jgi:hypothetical protein
LPFLCELYFDHGEAAHEAQRLGCAATAWLLAARARQDERMRCIGVFIGFAADDPIVELVGADRAAGARMA